MNLIQPPDASEYAEYYGGYIAQVPPQPILDVLRSQAARVSLFWQSIPESAATRVDHPYTWNIRQVMDHVNDGERIFGYRLLRIARGDTTELPGFDENHYAMASEEHPAPLTDIALTFSALRQANLLLLQNLSPQAWDRKALASSSSVSVRALAYILAGHCSHHDRILRQRLGGVVETPV